MPADNAGVPKCNDLEQFEKRFEATLRILPAHSAALVRSVVQPLILHLGETRATLCKLHYRIEALEGGKR